MNKTPYSIYHMTIYISPTCPHEILLLQEHKAILKATLDNSGTACQSIL